jgi:tetratricopeptide (TPR) repeat protein
MDALGQTPASTPNTRAAIAMALVKKGGEFLSAGEPEKALAAYRHARDILDGLSASKKDNTDLGLTLSLVYRKIGDAMRAQDDPEGAKEAFLSSLAIIEGLAKFHPDNAELQRHRAEALTAL